jgi:hypothetical protein
MPYKSAKQRAYLHIHEPKLAAEWDKKYSGKIQKPKPKKRRVKKQARPTAGVGSALNQVTFSPARSGDGHPRSHRVEAHVLQASQGEAVEGAPSPHSPDRLLPDRERQGESRPGAERDPRHLHAQQAINVVRCETGGTFRYRPERQYLGLFQMGSSERATYGHRTHGALAQARAAYVYFIVTGRDWSPWQCKP